MVLQRDTSTLGTVVGIIVFVVAIVGSVFLGWEWSAFPNQPVPLVIGAIAAVAAVLVTYRQIRG